MKNFMFLWFKKVMSNLASAKMAMFFLPFFGSCIFMYMFYDMYAYLKDLEVVSKEIISVINIIKDAFVNWLTFTVSLGGTIIVCREYFKVEQIKNDPETAKKIKDYQDEIKSE